MSDFSQIIPAVEKHKKGDAPTIDYGTAGFRTRADLLDHVVFRMGILAGLRSIQKKAAIGLMITASHNPECDNGVKIVDPEGEMLESSWEVLATEVGNIEDEKLPELLTKLITTENIDLSQLKHMPPQNIIVLKHEENDDEDKLTVNKTDNSENEDEYAFIPHVIIGRDTRSSSKALSDAAIEGVRALSSRIKVTDYGEVTTPMLHYFVVCTNTKGAYGEATHSGYFTKLISAYRKVRLTLRSGGRYTNRLYLDAANGVGAYAAKEIAKRLWGNLDICIFNDKVGTDKLNLECGADYVKINQKPPSGCPKSTKTMPKIASIDGDADRIVYYYEGPYNFQLFDGDRIATLIADFIKESLNENDFGLKYGLVQTAYANGSSTVYIEQVLKLPVYCVPTGVKYLHQKAKEEFDIGIYFEANGHGTVLFSEKAKRVLEQASSDPQISKTSKKSAERLLKMLEMVNQTVGDALSDMLLVELILRHKGWDLSCWLNTYAFYSTKQIKVRVEDKKIFETTDQERKLVRPKEVQEVIDRLILHHAKSRIFVRPSGTEDVVRVFAENPEQKTAELLAALTAYAVYRLAGGVGPAPVIPSSFFDELKNESKSADDPTFNEQLPNKYPYGFFELEIPQSES